MNARVALSHNLRIRYVHNEKAAVIRFKVALVIVVGKVPTADLAHTFVNTLRRLEAFLADNEPPFIAKLYRPGPDELARSSMAPGRVERWYPRR